MLENLLSFIISFLIGLLLGIGRERSRPEGTAALGVRTFILFSLLGTVASTINQPIITITLCIFVFSIILLSYYRSTHFAKKSAELGMTTELSAAIIFALGYMISYFPLTAITIGAVVLLVLIERKRLHIFSRKLQPQEIESLIIIIIFALGIIPVLPNHTIDPWQMFNPQKFGILLAVIASMQFGGYVAIRLFGQTLGSAITGFLGGFISSTAIYATLRSSLNEKNPWPTMASAIWSIIAVIIEIAIILLVASPTLCLFVIWPLLMMIVTSSIIIFILSRVKRHQASNQITIAPLRLSTIFISAILILIMLFLIAITKQYVGTHGIAVVLFLGGFFELHGVTLTTGLLFAEQQIQLQEAAFLLALAFLASFLTKFVLLWTLTPKRFAAWLSMFLLIIISSGGLLYYFVIV